MRIAIKFSDRDYNNTFFSVLRSILALWRYDPETIENLTKDELLLYINEVSLGHHYISNKSFRKRFPSLSIYDINDIKRYLEVNEIEINYEIDKDLNYQCIILDTDLDYDYNSPIYSWN